MASVEASNSEKKLLESVDLPSKSPKVNVNTDLESDDGLKDGQFWFWARQLISFTDDSSIVFAAFENGKFVKLQLIDVVQTLKDLDYFDEVQSINVLPHPSFIKITFVSESMVEIFKDTVAHVSSHLIKVVDKNAVPNICSISISNLPPNLIELYVLPQLKGWGEFIRFSNQFIPKRQGGRVQIGQTKILFKLFDNVTIQDLPYFVKVLTFKIYLHIPGRQRICFRCSSPEHMVTDCPLRYCGVCKMLKLIRHQCIMSYAAMVAPSEQNALIPIMHDKLLEVVGKEVYKVNQIVSDSSDSMECETGASTSSEEATSDAVVRTEQNKISGGKEGGNGGAVKNVRTIRTRSLSIDAVRKSYVDGGFGKENRKVKQQAAEAKRKKKRKNTGDDNNDKKKTKR